MSSIKSIVRGMAVIIFLFAVSSALPLLATHNPEDINLIDKLSQPSVQYYLGTDELGRDVLSRVLHGAATTLQVSIFAVLSSFLIGIVLGSVAGYRYGTFIDTVFNWIVGLLLSIPLLLLMASCVAIWKPGILYAYTILATVMWVGPARIVRAQVIKIRRQKHILAVRSVGMPEWQILFTIILPSCLEAAFIFSVSYLPEVIGLEAGLSFLGLGVQPPAPGLGKMIFDGLNFIYSAWWLTLSPSLLLFIIIILLNSMTAITRLDKAA